ncbi:MAG TPA: hypothetical protein VJN18_14300 [Polyangiaceae bacterium]|nr:hypothetical protein [Polyangiaceae bacterium]
MILLSCVNCCHNPLQSDAIGASSGYCTQHKAVLLAPSQLTCGRHFRKDLPATDAARERASHRERFSESDIVTLRGNETANGGYTSKSRADLAQLATSPVGVAVVEYGTLDTKIASISQLRFLTGCAPELALMSLARAYVNRCVENKGRWTSGLHLVWWTRARLLEDPRVEVTDLRTESSAPLARQVELAKWSLIMMRLLLISDVASYADKSDRISRLATLAERAAERSGVLSVRKLLQWIKREGQGAFDDALPERRYTQMAAQLHKSDDDPAA